MPFLPLLRGSNDEFHCITTFSIYFVGIFTLIKMVFSRLFKNKHLIFVKNTVISQRLNSNLEILNVPEGTLKFCSHFLTCIFGYEIIQIYLMYISSRFDFFKEKDSITNCKYKLDIIYIDIYIQIRLLWHARFSKRKLELKWLLRPI